MSGTRPWWFRLAAWVVALVVVAAVFVLALRSGSVAATTHTYADKPVAAPDGTLAASVSEVASYEGPVSLIGGVAISFDRHGASATAIADSSEVWSYRRTDVTLCAHAATQSRVLLFFGNDDGVCDEVIALHAATGKRDWQRTIEAAGPNQIVIGDGSFISIDPDKVILYEQSEGYERFTLSPRAEEGVAQATCEYLAASGTSAVPVLQRCQATSSDPWTYQVIVNAAADGKPRETGRTYLTLPEPELIGSMLDGTALVTSGGQLYAVPVGGPEPLPVAGVTITGSAQAATSIAGAGISAGGTGYVLTPDGRNLVWSGPTLSPLRIIRLQAVLIDAQGVLAIDPRSGAQAMRASIDPPVSGPVDDVQIVGPYLALTADGRTTLYR